MGRFVKILRVRTHDTGRIRQPAGLRVTAETHADAVNFYFQLDKAVHFAHRSARMTVLDQEQGNNL